MVGEVGLEPTISCSQSTCVADYATPRRPEREYRMIPGRDGARFPTPRRLRPMNQPRNRPSPLISHVLPISHVPQCELARPRRVGPHPDQPARGSEGLADPATPLTYHHEGSTCGEDRWRRSMGSEGSGRSRSLEDDPFSGLAHLRWRGDRTAAPASGHVGRHDPTPRGAAGVVRHLPGPFRGRRLP